MKNRLGSEETLRQFKERILQLTGVQYRHLPVNKVSSPPTVGVVAKRGSTYCCLVSGQAFLVCLGK